MGILNFVRVRGNIDFTAVHASTRSRFTTRVNDEIETFRIRLYADHRSRVSEAFNFDRGFAMCVYARRTFFLKEKGEI